MEEDNEKLYYSISEVAARFNVKPSLLRFWEKEFGLQPKKNSKGNRKYTQADIRQIETIHHLVKEKGMTLQGARNHLQKDPAKTQTDQEVVTSLKNLRSFLLSLREQLDQ